MKELLKTLLGHIVSVSKSLKDWQTSEAIETLEKTVDELNKEIEAPEEEVVAEPEATTEDAPAEPEAEPEAQELKKTVDEVIQVELKKWADLYLSADSAAKLVEEMKALSWSVSLLKEENALLKTELEEVKKVQAEAPSKQGVSKTVEKDVFANVFVQSDK